MSADSGMEKALQGRSGSKCELCGAAESLVIYAVPPDSQEKVDDSVLICITCSNQLDSPNNIDVDHWRCLNDSIWSQVPAVQVLSWRMLNRLITSDHALRWQQDILDIIYLDEATLSWAKAIDEGRATEQDAKHVDSNGAVLEAGDTVTLIKDLNVKGANFIAKRGTAVRGISLVADNAEQIEGKVNGQQVVILTKFVKKSS